MWSMAGVDEEDRLDRAEAVHVMRRAGSHAAAVPAPDARRRARSIVLSTATRARRALPRSLRHRPGHLEARRRGPRPSQSSATSSSPSIAFFCLRLQVALIGRIGEGFLRDLRVRAFDHLQRLSLGWHDTQKAGVVVSRLTSDIDSLAELVQMGLLMFVVEHAAAGRARSSCSAWCRGSCCSSPWSPCRRSSPPRSSSSATPTAPTCSCATASAPRCRRCRRGSPACGSSRPTPGSGARSMGSCGRSGELYDAHMDSVRISAWYLPVIEGAGVLTTAATLARRRVARRTTAT